MEGTIPVTKPWTLLGKPLAELLRTTADGGCARVPKAFRGKQRRQLLTVQLVLYALLMSPNQQKSGQCVLQGTGRLNDL